MLHSTCLARGAKRANRAQSAAVYSVARQEATTLSLIPVGGGRGTAQSKFGVSPASFAALKENRRIVISFTSAWQSTA
jgi:hypothetical protein